VPRNVLASLGKTWTLRECGDHLVERIAAGASGP
jgi:hypothetical protein